ncbi:MAG: hypothetical protein NVV72_06090 [Asticcacaulis sp.]|nr:hypothetical protein [Asticcacaulis sp.]
MSEISSELKDLLSSLNGLPLIAVKTAEYNALSLTFESQDANATYRLGTWFEDWNIFDREENHLVGRADATAIPNMNLGTFECLKMVGGKVRLQLSFGHYIEFSDRNMDDDIFYAFLPNQIFVGYTAKEGWRYGVSDRPWTGGKPI